MVTAAGYDLRSRKIPNWLVVLGFAVALALSFLQGAYAGLGTALSGFGWGIALMLPGYLLGFTGGGDVKITGVLGSLLGTEVLLYTFLVFGLGIGAWALIYGAVAVAKRGAKLPFERYGAMLRFVLTNGRLIYIPPDAQEVCGLRVPVAPALALASIVTPLAFR